MKRDMKKWIEELKSPAYPKPLPILSFPATALLGVTVREIISSSELQAQGMVAVAQRTDAAAAVSFMDLSVEAECFGAEVSVSDSEVPTVTGRVINGEDEASALAVPNIGSGRTGIYVEAIRHAADEITDRPVLAGMIGPFSLAARLFDVSEIMMDCYDDPDMVHTVLRKTTNFLIEYAKEFKNAGANGVIIAEPVAGLLSPSLEEEFSSPYIKTIVEAVQDDAFAVIYHNCGDNVSKMLDSILTSGCAAYHFGNSVDIVNDILARVPTDILVMGNIDPVGVLRMGSVDEVRAATLDLLSRAKDYPNFLLSSGCDIPPLTPWENVDAFFGACREFYN
jgi:uroporphyrinogen decarboxylase